MTQTSDILIGKSSGKKKALFAFPRLGSSLVLGMEGFALFNLYFTGFGVSALLVTLAQAIGYIVIGFGQFFLLNQFRDNAVFARPEKRALCTHHKQNSINRPNGKTTEPATENKY